MLEESVGDPRHGDVAHVHFVRQQQVRQEAEGAGEDGELHGELAHACSSLLGHDGGDDTPALRALPGSDPL
jgi:hypothetical protein